METQCLQSAQKASEVVLKDKERVVHSDEENYVIVKDLEFGDIPLKHTFPNGLYCREMLIRKGVFVVGQYHKGKTLNTLLTGHVSVVMDGQLFDIKAPCVFESTPGSKMVFAHEDSRWMTTQLNPCNETDLVNLTELLMDGEKSFTDQNQVELNAFIKVLTPQLCLGS